MRKAFLIAATMAAFVGASAAARGAKAAAPDSQRPAGQMPLPHDAYPDELSFEIWNAV